MKRTLELIYARDLGDGRVVDQDMVDQVASNHTTADKYPVAKGHDASIGMKTDAEPAAGFVTNLRMMGRSLVGDVTLTPQVEQEYADGFWPGWSVGIKRKFAVQDGNRVYGDWVMGHLALMGSTEAAFKDLQELTGIEGFSSIGETAEFSASNHEYMLLTVAANTDELSPSDDVSTLEAPAEVGSIKNQEEEMETHELEMKLSAAEEKSEALQAQLESLLSERRDAAKANFSAAGKAIIGKLQNLGVSETARDNFSASLEALAELAADGTDFGGLFAAVNAALEEVAPKVTPGDVTPKEDKEEVGNFQSGRDATASLIL